VNDNGISALALAFFSGLFTFLGIIAKGVFDTRKTARQAQNEASSANQSAKKAQANTDTVANGFTGKVVTKLTSIESKIDDNSRALREHLEWHLDREAPKR
jgi:hypothetical protein